MGAVVHRKIAILGYPCVGKSSITLRYVYGSFPDGYETTIEDVHTKTHFFNGKEFDLEITDTAGQQEYSLFPRSVSVDVDGYILVYAIDDRKSFEIIRAIYEKLMENYCDRNTPLVLVGNKLDLQHNNRQVTTEEGKRLAASWDAAFHETSAKDNTAVQPIFDSILRKIEIANGNMRRPRNNCVIS
uniref:GTP-binding protein Rheb n=1 Tax=Syphacia muris TaxID=451379 RepID=A0A0N5AQF7_9BILA